MGFASYAQINHFVYVQTDNKQAFYIRLNEKLYSSSASGYLIIPKLQSGNHLMIVGFPKNEWPAKNITIPVLNKDIGYILKNFESKGWGLFNMQTMDIVILDSSKNLLSEKKTESRSDEFSNTLADVVNTPSIKEINTRDINITEVEKPKEPSKISQDAKTSEYSIGPSTSLPVVEKVVLNKITKINEVQTGEGTIFSYLVMEELKTDTIILLIPKDEITDISGKKIDSAPLKTDAPEILQPNTEKLIKKNDPKFIDIELSNPSIINDSVHLKTNVPEKKDSIIDIKSKLVVDKKEKKDIQGVELKMINSDCKSLATEEDYLKILKKMTAQKSDDDMINAANKVFKQKCFNVEQVKNLSVLFLKDDGKYKFFDTAYPHVYDTPNFNQLELQLTDTYFKSRFKAMIRN